MASTRSRKIPRAATGARHPKRESPRPADERQRTSADGVGDRVDRDELPRDLAARTDALAERVKELAFLYAIPNLIQERHADLGFILQKIVDALPSAMRYTDRACASIILNDRRYQTAGWREPGWRQAADIQGDGERIGRIEIGYTATVPGGRDPEFLPEEKILLNTVAERVAEIVALKETKEKLTTYQENLRSLASELTLAEERQRRELAIALHDRIGQGLAVAKLKLETMMHVLPAEHHARLEDIAALIKQIVSDTRSLTFEISPPILYELGLRQALAWLGDHFRRQFGLTVEVRCDGEPVDLHEGVRVTLYRSVQELLTNIVKHARASRAKVSLAMGGGEVRILVEDDGAGFDASRSRGPSSSGCFGLFSIRERLGHLGGSADVDAAPGRGTRVELRVPCAAGKGGGR